MTPSGKTPVKLTIRSVVRRMIFIPGTNEIALGSGSLARAFTTSDVACTLTGVRFWQTRCSGNIEDAVGTATLPKLVNHMYRFTRRVLLHDC